MSLAYEVYKEGGLLNGRYQKLEDISEGAYGIVSLAKDRYEPKLVAVKYVFKLEDEKPSKRTDIDYSKSLTINKMNDDICEEALHEIAIHEKLGFHKNIISFLDCFDSFIILEYCPRGDLYEALKDDTGPRSNRDIVNVTSQLISAVQFAHDQSIYHRDIKPENILIASDWTIRLSDWGLATTQRYCSDFGVGSERYMAPELFDQENIDVYDAAKCDIWSIGICLLNLVFHKSPFTAATQKDKSFSFFARNREALFDIFSSMSIDLFAVLRYSLTLDPDNRDLSNMELELLKVQSLTIDDDLKQLESENETDVFDTAQPIHINPSTHTKKAHRKSFAIPTPNTHINNHFHEFQKHLFNRKDLFTPPSESSQYMEKLEKNRKNVYQPPHQRPSTPKSSGLVGPHYHDSFTSIATNSGTTTNPKSSHRRGRGSFSSAGKYVPPPLRSPSTHKNADALVFDDDDDDLFVLEETDTPNSSTFDTDNNTISLSGLTIDDNDLSDVSSAPSLLAHVSSNVKSETKAHSSTIHNRNSSNHKLKYFDGNSSSSSGSSSSGSQNNHKKVYVPPHHRSSFHSHLKKPLNHTSNQNHSSHNQNFHHYHNGRRSSITKKELVSSSAPTRKTDWFSHHHNPGKIVVDDYDDEVEEEDEDFENSEAYKTFASRVRKLYHHDSKDLQTHNKHFEKHSQIRESITEITSVVD